VPLPPVEEEECWAGFAENQAPLRLNDVELNQRLSEDGYAVIPEFLGPAEIEALIALFGEQASPLHQLPFASSIRSDDRSYKSTVTVGIGRAFSPAISRHFNGYRYCFAGFLVKAPVPEDGGSEGTVPMHQDIAMVNEAKYQGLGIWVPLMDVDEGNGCLAIVPKSHRWSRKLRWPGSTFAFKDQKAELEQQVVTVPLRAGSAIVYCQKLIHTSAPNSSSATRLVAGALAAPNEAPLVYFHGEGSDEVLDVYAVDDSFYTAHNYGERPTGVPRVARVKRSIAGR
jgi:hypothetical protein